MTSPIDPIRRTGAGRRAGDKVDSSARAPDVGDRSLPVPIEPPPEPPPPPLAARPAAPAAFAAHLLGQDGQKRGLRGGPATLDAAKTSYNRTEYSGAADRRAKSGRGAKTEI